jgi:hypothetical protein
VANWLRFSHHTFAKADLPMTIALHLYGVLGKTKQAGLAALLIWRLTLPLPVWAQAAVPGSPAQS